MKMLYSGYLAAILLTGVSRPQAPVATSRPTNLVVGFIMRVEGECYRKRGEDTRRIADDDVKEGRLFEVWDSDAFRCGNDGRLRASLLFARDARISPIVQMREQTFDDDVWFNVAPRTRAMTSEEVEFLRARYRKRGTSRATGGGVRRLFAPFDGSDQRPETFEFKWRVDADAPDQSVRLEVRRGEAVVWKGRQTYRAGGFASEDARAALTGIQRATASDGKVPCTAVVWGEDELVVGESHFSVLDRKNSDRAAVLLKAWPADPFVGSAIVGHLSDLNLTNEVLGRYAQLLQQAPDDPVIRERAESYRSDVDACFNLSRLFGTDGPASRPRGE